MPEFNKNVAEIQHFEWFMSTLANKQKQIGFCVMGGLGAAGGIQSAVKARRGPEKPTPV